jgi:hypothetical protein
MAKIKKSKMLLIIYLVLFIIFSYFATENNFSNNYNIYIIICGIINYVILNAGIVIHVFAINNKFVTRFWKYAFIYSIIYFIVSYFIDSYYGKNRNVDLGGIAGNILFIVFVSLIYLPAFWSSYSIAFRYNKINIK